MARARRIRGWERDLAAVYGYFDDDARGYAAHDALSLELLRG